MKKVILFDLDDTLLWDKRSVEEALQNTCSDVFPENAEKLLQAILDTAPGVYSTYPFYDFTQKIGINPFEGLWGTFPDETFDFPVMGELIGDYQFQAWHQAFQRLGIHDEAIAQKAVKTFKSYRLASPYLYDETLEVLEEVSSKYRLGLLTNGAPSLQETKLELTPELSPYFEHIVISGEVGIGKPDQTPFQELLSRFEVGLEDAIMVGDNLKTDILGAASLGMESIWINHHGLEIPESPKPTYTVARLSGVLDIFDKLNRL